MGKSRYIPPSVFGALCAAKVSLDLLRRARGLRGAINANNPTNAAYKVTSQNGEDGIIANLLRRIGGGHGPFVEFGFEPRESNMMAHALLNRTSGLFIDGNEHAVSAARTMFHLMGRRDIQVRQAWLEPDIIDGLISEYYTGEIDVLSVDVDGNDYWLLRAIDCVRPKLLVAEYNPAFGAELAVTIPYKAGFDRSTAHPSWMYYGASLAALVNLAREKGYMLVCTEPTAPNAFFVRKDLLGTLQERSVTETLHLATQGGMTPKEQEKMLRDMPLVEV